MKLYILSAVIFFQTFSAGAQQRSKKIIHAGERLSDYFTYRFPAFKEATVLLKNGDTLTYKMNFNMLLYSMEFINPKGGDTLEISTPEDIDSIRFNNSTFFFKDDYFEILAAFYPVKLIVSRKANIEGVMLGAMGLPARNYQVEGIDKINPKSLMTLDLRLNQDIYVYGKTDYFLISNEGEFKATKPNFLKIFKDDKKSIENFLKLNKVNFNNQEDLEKLFHFCTHT
jgi:hypothetical protein